MKSKTRSRLWIACLCAGGFFSPLLGITSSASAFDTDLKNDARLEGYKNRSPVMDTSPAQYYLLFGGLTIVGVGVMLIDAKRGDLTK